MRILYVGSLDPVGTCRMRMEALEELGHTLTAIETRYASRKGPRRWCARLANYLGTPLDLADVNKAILARTAEAEFDLLWIDKTVVIKAKTLNEFARRQPGAKSVSYSLDDMLNPNNTSCYYKKCISVYDLHVTTKSYNVDELLTLGARRVIHVNNAYHTSVHKPHELSPEERAEWGEGVGFIGTFERERASFIESLADAGIDVVVRGDDRWNVLDRHPRITHAKNTAHGSLYAKCISATRINLGFLRKVNRDLQTTRTVEIPACGGFMLAERTQEQCSLFEEGVEAEYFGDPDELIQKCRYYLAHETERKLIASRGRERCLRSGYSYHAQLEKLLNEVNADTFNS